MKAFLTEYEIRCPDPQRFFSRMEQMGIETCGMVSQGDLLRISVPALSAGRFEKCMEQTGAEYRKTYMGIFCRIPGVIKKRAGLVIGAAVCAAAIMVSRLFVLNIEVLTDDETIRAGVMNVLEENGVKAGCLISKLDCAPIERSLKQRVEGISWAGISKTDSTLIIDVIKKVEKPKSSKTRLPSDLVAKHSGVIEDIELYDGLLKVPVGSGVERGEVIVSGRIPVEKTVSRDGKRTTEYSERYVRSLGTAYGTYSLTRSFTQEYTEQSMVMNGSRDDVSYLSLFGTDLPLFIGREDGLFRERASYSPLVIFDRELPVGIKTVTREGYSFRSVSFTREQAKACAEEQMNTFELDFLPDEKIISREIDTFYGERGITLTVKYLLYGVMSEEKQFFIKK